MNSVCSNNTVSNLPSQYVTFLQSICKEHDKAINKKAMQCFLSHAQNKGEKEMQRASNSPQTSFRQEESLEQNKPIFSNKSSLSLNPLPGHKVEIFCRLVWCTLYASQSFNLDGGRGTTDDIETIIVPFHLFCLPLP